jgi:hypothetical protein
MSLNHRFSPQIFDHARSSIARTMRRVDSAMQFALLTDMLSDWLVVQPVQAAPAIMQALARQLTSQMQQKLQHRTGHGIAHPWDTKPPPQLKVIEGMVLPEEGQLKGDHDLKSWPHMFDDMVSGLKNFDSRTTADRDFRLGQHIVFHEWDPETSEFTGRSIRRQIIYILDPDPAIDPDCGLAPDFVVLGLKSADVDLATV